MTRKTPKTSLNNVLSLFLGGRGEAALVPQELDEESCLQVRKVGRGKCLPCRRIVLIVAVGMRSVKGRTSSINPKKADGPLPNSLAGRIRRQAAGRIKKLTCR